MVLRGEAIGVFIEDVDNASFADQRSAEFDATRVRGDGSLFPTCIFKQTAKSRPISSRKSAASGHASASIRLTADAASPQIGPARPVSHPLHEAVDHALLARLVEPDRELVAADRRDIAVAELEMEHAIPDPEGGGRAGRAGDQLALDGER